MIDTKELLLLFWAFARVGAMTFGGGYAMLPILQREIVEKRAWATEEELGDYFAVGQCTPGVIAVNTATFIGYKRKGAAGGIAATVGVVFPSFLLILALAGILLTYAALPAVSAAFSGIRVAVTVLIFRSVCRLFENAVKGKWALGIFLTVFLFSAVLHLSAVLSVLLAGFTGLLLTAFSGKGESV